MLDYALHPASILSLLTDIVLAEKWSTCIDYSTLLSSNQATISTKMLITYTIRPYQKATETSSRLKSVTMPRVYRPICRVENRGGLNSRVGDLVVVRRLCSAGRSTLPKGARTRLGKSSRGFLARFGGLDGVVTGIGELLSWPRLDSGAWKVRLG